MRTPNRVLSSAALASAALLGVGTRPATAVAAKPQRTHRHHAATLVQDRLYGGGWIESRYSASTEPVAFVNVIRHGSTVDFYGDVNGVCQAGASTFHEILSFYPSKVPLHAGRFSATGTTAGSGSQGTPGMTYTLSGRALSDSRVSGSAQVHGSYTVPGRGQVTCASQTYSYTVLDPTQAGLRGTLTAAGAYYGNQYTRNARFPFLLRVGATMRTIEEARVETLMTCSSGVPVSGGSFVYQPLLYNDAIKPSASFDDTDNWTQAMPGLSGYTAATHSEIKGRFGSRRLVGSWQIEMTVTNDATHQVVGVCTSGDMPYEATL